MKIKQQKTDKQINYVVQVIKEFYLGEKDFDYGCGRFNRLGIDKADY